MVSPNYSFLITLCADCCLVDEGRRQAISVKMAVALLATVAQAFVPLPPGGGGGGGGSAVAVKYAMIV